ncbi:hypothetical protein A5789_07280 [Nocardia sp. 852002-51101_SCH5132738]|nr:hypothetical protein A5789_07280 [Nocardia sp. 852002-51101_SCH5132738]OBB48853.1 hypothetical protein A5748_01405 [Nocardia sp. 852002-51244_SCH5132740]OBF72985.1 hypothetical protein A9X06_27785 [Mycobacterium sp. 852002-51759_SCH5129042]
MFVATTIGLISVAALIITELRAEHPLIDVRLFRRRGFSSGALSITIQFLVTFGVMFLSLFWDSFPCTQLWPLPRWSLRSLRCHSTLLLIMSAGLDMPAARPLTRSCSTRR